MTAEILKYYKEIEELKLSLVMKVGELKIYAASCPSFGDDYKAMMVIADENNKYRYSLLTGKQVLIEDEYSTIPPKTLRQIESVLAMSYVGNVSANIHTFYESMLTSIDSMNANTENWVKVKGNPDFETIPKFSNRRKPAKKNL